VGEGRNDAEGAATLRERMRKREREREGEGGENAL